jgi:thioredoxin-dependent peroxiredoxin
MPDLNDAAPDFTLIGVDAERYSLSAHRGETIVLAFYRGDDSPTCSRQLVQYAETYKELRALGADMWGVSPDSTKSHYAFGCRLDIPFPLLADEDWYVAKLYGVDSRVLGYGRATFIIDGEGVLRRVMKPAVGGLLTYTSAADILTAVKSLSA